MTGRSEKRARSGTISREMLESAILADPTVGQKGFARLLGCTASGVRSAARRYKIKLPIQRFIRAKSSNKFFPRVQGTLRERFDHSYVTEPNTGCWLWVGDTNGKYPSIGVMENGKMHRRYAHRISYELFKGPIPTGEQIDHQCNTSMCVNPAHLKSMTNAENMARVPPEKFARYKTHCPSGHPYQPGRKRRGKNGRLHNYCPTCFKAHRKKYEETSGRPKRRNIPMAIRRAIAARQNGKCPCGCDLKIVAERGHGVEWDHVPALRLRDLAPDGDYTPHQHDPRYIVARCKASHGIKTRGVGATTAGTDIGKIKKERKREKARAGIEKPKRKIPSRGFAKQSKGKGGRPWPKRKLGNQRRSWSAKKKS